jgi:hypothetical protein
MKLTVKPLIAAALIASAQLSGVAFAQTTKTPAAPTVQVAPTPMSEEPQRHFVSAVEAFARKDYKTAGMDGPARRK